MSSRRRVRLLAVVLSLWALLFSQMAVAGYACESTGRAVQVAQMTEAGLPCAASMAVMDDEQPSLCHAHCQSGQNTVGDSQLQPGQPVAQAGIVAVLQSPTVAAPTDRASAFSRLRATSGPPLAILHCCFRI